MTEPSLPEESIFAQAVDIASPAERAAFLDRVCSGNAALRVEMEALLRAHSQSGDLLDMPEQASVATEAGLAREAPGVMIGPYKLLEHIGEGGMGAVWMAEQIEPIHRRVAVKVVKEGMDTKQILARFEAERQALALMDHPNIARVLDAGRTPWGHPFFVMELVKGQPITRYCDEKRLPVRERLQLFADVCAAVQHAHQKGIIHRDLKPSNVMVAPYDRKPVVKVIDFGVAKAAGQRLTAKTLFTGFGALVGTPEYMSPEQAEINNHDIDTRSDIYSLGVLLYELLTGSTPLTRKRLKNTALLEVLQMIRDQEPPRPSTRLSESKDTLPSISAQRQAEPMQLTKLVRGELDWIAMKALEKDRNRRYETANSLALDVQRYLSDEPVTACPPSARYRLRKFVRRRRGQVTAAMAILALLLAGTGVSTWQALRATHAEKRTGNALAAATAAQAQTREALDTLTDNVVETMFARQQTLGEQDRAFLHKVVGFYEDFTQQSGQTPEATFLRAKGYYTVAHLRGLLGQHKEAIAGYKQAEALLEQLTNEFPDKVVYREKLAKSEHSLGIEFAKSGMEAPAETAFRRGVDEGVKLTDASGPNLAYRQALATIYHDFAFFRELQHRYEEAEDNYRRALDLLEKVVAEAPDEPRHKFELSVTLSAFAGLLRKEEKYPDAEKIYRRALKNQEEHNRKGEATARDRHQLANSYHGLAIVLAELNKNQEAEDAFRRSLAMRRKLIDDFPGALDYRHELANDVADFGYFLRRLAKYAAALAPYREQIELRQAILKQGGPAPTYRRELAAGYDELGFVLRMTHRSAEAETASHHAMELWQQLLVEAPKNPDYQDGLAESLTNLALLHNERHEFAAAIVQLEQAQTNLKPALGVRPKDSTFRLSYREYLKAIGESYLGQHNHARAAAVADELADFGYDPANDTYAAAALLGRCVTLVDKDTKLSQTRRRELVRNYTDRARKRLKQALAHGYKDKDTAKDLDLAPLRGPK